MYTKRVSILLCALLAGASLAEPLGVSARTAAAVTITVDANANRHQINPNVYGVSFASTAALADLNAPVNRWGGNRTSRYNWQGNADATGSDWYFETWAYGSATPAAEADRFISQTRAAGSSAMMTIPMVGYVAKVGPNRERYCSYSVETYGAQADADWQWFPDAGNGVRLDGSPITDNDPNDAGVPSDATFQRGFVEHMVDTFGPASAGGTRFLILDNEPSIWHETHRDVHPVGQTRDELREKSIDYGTMCKQVDPTALVVGPEEFGWAGYIHSGFDLQYGNATGDWWNLPDRGANGGMDHLPWFLDQMRRHNEQTGVRALDVFSVHYYPQSGEYSNDTSTSMQRLRNRSTRSLWDPSYVDESWIGDTVRLVPRLREWVNTYYPGTLTAVTEYNWGALNHVNGATAEADALGIFGREGLDLAVLYTDDSLDPSTPVYKAIKMYRNYDGQRSTFGDVSVAATAPNPDEVSAFAAERTSDGALTVMVVAKEPGLQVQSTINLVGFDAGATAQVFQLTSANQIQRLADVAVADGRIVASLPAQSVTLFVIPEAQGGGAQAPAVTVTKPNGGETYMQTSFMKITWTASGTIDHHEVRLSSDGGQTYPTLIATVSGATRYVKWQVPSTFPVGRNYKVMVVAFAPDGQTGSDASDNTFRIRRSF